MVLSGRFVGLAAAGVLVAIASATAAWLYLAALVAVGLIDLLLAAPVAAQRMRRAPVGSLRLGRTTHTTLEIVNSSSRPLRALVRDAWVPSAGLSPARQTLRLQPGAGGAIVSQLTPTRRGAGSAARVTLRSYGPLGVTARQRQVAVPGVVHVLPPFTSRKFLPEKLSRLRFIEGTVLVRQRGRGSEFDALRTYVIGDEVRALDWRATARSRDLVVRTWRPERDRSVVLALDTGRSAAARLGDAPRLDASIDAGLLLGALAARAGDRVALVAADTAVRARTGLIAGRAVLPTLVTALAPLEPVLAETDPTLLAAEVLRQITRRSLVVLFGSLDTAPDTGLVPAARSLVSRHEVVVASVSDPSLDELASGRGTADAVYAAAAAESAVLARDRVVAELTRIGVHVVSAAADVFASTVADAYLDLKAAGRL